MKNLFKEAHDLTKEIKAEYPEVDYKAQFAICLSYLQEMKGDSKMVELKGSEKQVKWAECIRKELLEKIEEAVNMYSTLIVNAKEKGQRFPKKYIKNINSLEELSFLVKHNDSAKYFIEEYRSLISLECWELNLKL
ncbi:hypothetical protein [Clostridium tetani]|uniref:hypothetical protein n=1 Tax=Clostridium tetani TaxID=1513 RepID=UPI0016730136|nr:hypothetical protein [Clostridium tetani]